MKDKTCTYGKEFKISGSGRISKTSMKDILKHMLKDNLKQGQYFVKDTSGREEVFTLFRTRENVEMNCEVVNENIDRYNSLIVPRYGNKIDYSYSEYESYNVE